MSTWSRARLGAALAVAAAALPQSLAGCTPATTIVASGGDGALSVVERAPDSHEHELQVRSHALSGNSHDAVGRSADFVGATRSLGQKSQLLVPRSHRLRSAVRPPPVVRRERSVVVWFEFDSADVSKSTGDLLREKTRRMLRNAPPQAASLVIDVSGHADHIGSQNYNRDLSRRRANAVADLLVAHRIDVHKWAYGETCPHVVDRTSGRDLPAARHINRRVVISLAARQPPTRAQECTPRSDPTATPIRG